jgi:hypothetical protein
MTQARQGAKRVRHCRDHRRPVSLKHGAYFPLAQDAWHKPLWKLCVSDRQGRPLHVRSQQLLGESDGACYPMVSSALSAQAQIPVEIGGSGFESNADVAEPEGALAAFSKEVITDHTQVVFIA